VTRGEPTGKVFLERLKWKEQKKREACTAYYASCPPKHSRIGNQEGEPVNYAFSGKSVHQHSCHPLGTSHSKQSSVLLQLRGGISQRNGRHARTVWAISAIRCPPRSDEMRRGGEAWIVSVAGRFRLPFGQTTS